MKPITSHRGRAVPLRRSEVDTDQIIPAEHCKRVSRRGLGEHLFSRWRADPEFILNRPERRGGTVLVADHDFGTGSSREHAVWALQGWGFAALVSSRFGDIFARNALRNGLLPVTLKQQVVNELLDRSERDPSFIITVDLVDLRVRTDQGEWDFHVDSRERSLLLEGLDDVEITLQRNADIAAFEAGRPHWFPTIERRAARSVAGWRA